MSARWVALLRGVNVGGRTKVPMASLRDDFAEAGATGVRTHLNSGNVIFEAASKAAATKICATVEAALEETHGRRLGILLRGHRELKTIVARDPYPDIEAKFVQVVFLSTPAPASAVERLRGLATGDESVTAEGREIYLSMPGGMGRSKLGAAAAKPHDALVATARNWRTVTALADLSAPAK